MCIRDRIDTIFEDKTENIIRKHDIKLRDLELKVAEEIDQFKGQINYPTNPQKPQKYDGEAMTMELDLEGDSANGFIYKGTIWEILNERVEASVSSVVWENFDLSHLYEDTYELQLSKGDQKARLKVRPVLVGNDYDNAVKEFEQQFADYQKELAKIEAEVAAKKKEIEARLALEKEVENKSFEEKIAALRAEGHDNYATDQVIQRTVINRFQIDRFGIWNCDRPRPPYLATLDGSFQDQHFNRYKNRMVYQADKSQNTVRRFYLKDIAENVQYNADSKNILWLVTDDNQLAVFPPNYFQRIKQKEGEYAFEMDLNPQKIDSEADVREILQL